MTTAGLLEPTVARRPRLEFWVPGKPQTAGSKRAFTNPKTGRAIVTESGNAAAKRAWRSDLRDAAERAIFELPPGTWDLGVPMKVMFLFVRARPKAHYRVDGSIGERHVPARPVQRPDLLKLARAAEDALTGVVWSDDSLIVAETLAKMYGDQCTPEVERGVEGVRVRVRRFG